MTKTTVNLQAINDVKEFVNIVMKYAHTDDADKFLKEIDKFIVK